MKRLRVYIEEVVHYSVTVDAPDNASENDIKSLVVHKGPAHANDDDYSVDEREVLSIEAEDGDPIGVADYNLT